MFFTAFSTFVLASKSDPDPNQISSYGPQESPGLLFFSLSAQLSKTKNAIELSIESPIAAWIASEVVTSGGSEAADMFAVGATIAAVLPADVHGRSPLVDRLMAARPEGRPSASNALKDPGPIGCCYPVPVPIGTNRQFNRQFKSSHADWRSLHADRSFHATSQTAMLRRSSHADWRSSHADRSSHTTSQNASSYTISRRCNSDRHVRTF